ncbi:protein of unknown function [Modestobacter italicus]|uniref:Uncharacterized protein n=1 Tax=Modestobacter italicus (strain DSM 44449 / CECT 9708 / BC 501) TaxID=2732864 RepID=I4F4K3_MODI5|nr:protein of unknown function [Modestobacter marinus]
MTLAVGTSLVIIKDQLRRWVRRPRRGRRAGLPDRAGLHRGRAATGKTHVWNLNGGDGPRAARPGGRLPASSHYRIVPRRNRPRAGARGCAAAWSAPERRPARSAAPHR